MENPFEKLKIRNITIMQMYDTIKARKKELENEWKFTKTSTPTLFHAKIALEIFNNERILGKGENLEFFLNERYRFGFSPDRQFLTEEEQIKISNQIKALRDSGNLNTNNPKLIKDYYKLIMAQVNKIKNNMLKYENCISSFSNNLDNDKPIETLKDLYIEQKYEDEVISLAQRIAEKLGEPKSIEDKTTFINELTTDPRYIELNKAYKKIGTQQCRNDINSESYVKSRNIDTSGITVISPKEVKRLVKKEENYRQDWIQGRKKTALERDQEQISENPDHDYSWGIILSNPMFLFKNEPVDNPIFKGNITVEHLGSFSEASFFRKRRDYRYKKQETVINVFKKNILNPKYKIKERNEKNNAKPTIREYFWKSEPTKRLYDQIYRVTKTDSQGITKKSIVFSPVTYSDIGKKVSADFLKNIYFSDYMLEIAEKNGGYAGKILTHPNGYSISNKYSQDEISSAILFANGAKGNICDCRGKQKATYYDTTKEDFLKILKNSERIKDYNE